MIVSCPQCHQKNRLPDTAAFHGRKTPRPKAICGVCGTSLPIPTLKPARGSWFARLGVGLIFFLDGLFLLLLTVFSLFDAFGPERWWVTGFLLYMPRWIWAIGAAVLLVPTALIAVTRFRVRRRWKMTFALLLALGWILGPVMGLEIPLRLPAFGSAATETRLRVLTYNIKWGRGDMKAVVREIERSQPDLIQMQDAGPVLQTEVGQLLTQQNGWNVRKDARGQYVVASRWPISEITTIELLNPGSGSQAVRTELTPPGSPPITLYNVHLMTPRYGLLSVRDRHKAVMKENLDERLQQTNRIAAAMLAGPPGPVVLTGDLNSPPPSLAKRRLRDAGLRDVFEAVGLGYGYTYGQSTKIGRPFLRIDCIMTSPDIRPGAIHVGNSTGSEHCPVIADLYLPRQ